MLEAAQVLSMVRTPLASTLFGDAAFAEDGLFLTGPIKEFCDILIVQTWHPYRKGLARENRVITKNRTELEVAWAGEYLRCVQGNAWLMSCRN